MVAMNLPKITNEAGGTGKFEDNVPEEPGSLVLVGMMGAGKTTVGKILSRHLGKPFFDSDREIQKQSGATIPVIFEYEGEAGFRKRETEILGKLVRIGHIVLATGGGAILSPENRAMLRASGTVIYLRASADDLWHRTRQDTSRPLLQTDNPRARIGELSVLRDPLYRETAHIVVESGKQSAQRLAQIIMQALADHRNKSGHGSGKGPV